MREADSIFPSVTEFAAHLRALREERLARKSGSEQTKAVRRSITQAQRAEVLEKTGGRCHICGGQIIKNWTADHVYAHAYGGSHTPENYLPAHITCNGARWFYGTEEFQWILKLGVYFRTQLEEEGDSSAIALAQRFVEHEKKRNSRRKNPLPCPESRSKP